MKPLLVAGTRPEVIKLAPLFRALERRPACTPQLCIVEQQDGTLDRALEDAGLSATLRVPLEVEHDADYLARAAAVLIPTLEDRYRALALDWVVVQGDTLTTWCAAEAARRCALPLAHVEAGLRTGDENDPFPEERFRRRVTRIAHVHYAPSESAHGHLLAEGVPSGRILRVGNTGIDTLLEQIDIEREASEAPVNGARRLLVTMHRSENHGPAMHGVCAALLELVARYDHLAVDFVLHPNPAACSTARERLSDSVRIALHPPLAQRDFLGLLRRCDIVLSDSGGVQEEAPYLGKPVLVARATTERTETVGLGLARVVGNERGSILGEVSRLLDDPACLRRMSRCAQPFGTGNASELIADHLMGRDAAAERSRSWLERLAESDAGAVLSWDNPNKPGYAYPEATALALRLAAQLDQAPAARRRWARYLQSCTSPAGGIGRDGVDYLFDTAIALVALGEHERATGESTSACRELQLAFVLASLEARLVRTPAGGQDHWSQRFGPHLLKSIGLAVGEARRMGAAFPDPTTTIAALLEHFDGERFATDPAGRTYAHAHAYALEGLLLLEGQGFDGYGSPLRSGAAWLARAQAPSGALRAWYDDRGPSGPERLDATSQAMRIWLCVDPSAFADPIQRAARFLDAHSGPNSILPYEPGSMDLNPWVSVFAAQARSWHARGQGSPPDLV